MVSKACQHGDEDEEEEDSSPVDEMNEDEENLDMPPPWSPKLYVSPEKYAERTRGG
jgi:hypothetical protein